LNRLPRLATFSIVAYDKDEDSWGVAVASKFLAAGALVPFARAGAGAVATQSLANLSYGPDGLDLMEGGLSAEETLKKLLEVDTDIELRQVGLVDAQGQGATFTGEDCFDWAGGAAGYGYAIQGNILAGDQVIRDMEKTFLESKGELAQRLVKALAAGDKAGGDRRGKQSAAVVVVKPHGSYGGYIDRFVDLRVDDHPQPVEELERLLRLHHIFLGAVKEGERIKIEGELAHELQQMLKKQGYYDGPLNSNYDEATRTAMENFVNTENLEHRVDIENGLIDPPALDYIRSSFVGE